MSNKNEIKALDRMRAELASARVLSPGGDVEKTCIICHKRFISLSLGSSDVCSDCERARMRAMTGGEELRRRLAVRSEPYELKCGRGFVIKGTRFRTYQGALRSMSAAQRRLYGAVVWRLPGAGTSIRGGFDIFPRGHPVPMGAEPIGGTGTSRDHDIEQEARDVIVEDDET